MDGDGMDMRDPVAVVKLADLYLHCRRDDWTYSALMRDPRAHEVAEPGPPMWARGNMAPAPDWRPGGKGLPPLAWATQFCLQRKLPFSYFDIGANVGLEGLAEATLHARCGCSFPVHLFEPSPLSSLIERSVGANGVVPAIST